MLLHRILLVSDMHYATEAADIATLKQNLKVKMSLAAGDAFGHTQKEKINMVSEAVLTEHAKSPLDAVLVLGDLSIDDYGYRNLPYNYCEMFKQECMDKWPCPAYALAGNHDSYPPEAWQAIFGYGRQFAIEIGNTVFLMLDTYRNYLAKSASGSGYSGVDTAYLRKMLAKYKNKKIFLCAHYINPGAESAEFLQIVRECDDIIALFSAHTHLHKVIQCEELGNKPLIDIGGYAYNGFEVNGKYTFGIFDEAWAWGYQMVEIYSDNIQICHKTPQINYRADNGNFSVTEKCSDICIL